MRRVLRMSARAAVVAGCVAVGSGVSSGTAGAAPIGTSVVVERIGGDASYNGLASKPAALTAAAVFLDEFSQADGTRAQTIALPTASSGSVHAVTEYYGNDSFNGYLSRSANGTFLVTTGYDAAPGTASVISGAPARRPLAMIGMDGTVDTATTYRWSSSSAQRSVAAAELGKFYFVTDSSAQGTRYVAGTGTTAQQTPAASEGRIVQNAHRAVRIFDGKLFISSGSSTIGPGLAMVDPDGTGLPTASTSPDFSLPTLNFATTSGGNPEQFVLLDLNANGFHGTSLDTAYVADGTLGLQKWTFDGTAWSLAYTNATSGGLLGLDYAGKDAAGNPILYATNVGNGSTGNSLLKLVDAGVDSPFAVIATSPTNTYFRGVAAVPEPASVGVIGAGLVGLLARRRRRA